MKTKTSEDEQLTFSFLVEQINEKWGETYEDFPKLTEEAHESLAELVFLNFDDEAN